MLRICFDCARYSIRFVERGYYDRYSSTSASGCRFAAVNSILRLCGNDIIVVACVCKFITDAGELMTTKLGGEALNLRYYGGK